MNRRRGTAKAPASTPPPGGLFALTPIEELDDERMKALLRRRALYVIGGAILSPWSTPCSRG